MTRGGGAGQGGGGDPKTKGFPLEKVKAFFLLPLQKCGLMITSCFALVWSTLFVVMVSPDQMRSEKILAE